MSDMVDQSDNSDFDEDDLVSFSGRKIVDKSLDSKDQRCYVKQAFTMVINEANMKKGTKKCQPPKVGPSCKKVLCEETIDLVPRGPARKWVRIEDKALGRVNTRINFTCGPLFKLWNKTKSDLAY